MRTSLSAEYVASGKKPKRTGSDNPIVAPYGLFEASDGQIAVAPAHDVMVERFLGVLGLSYLLAEPDYSDNARRMANRPSLNARINAVTRGKQIGRAHV